ncbi:HXXEE domain-containing protein [Solibacillus silvestris]|uniref:HXXEE domain-containing protein n=1 Tax=Solibacillus silvestris TaxID=76853 RepID=UPI003F7D07F0
MQSKNTASDYTNSSKTGYYAVFFCLAITLHNLEEALWLPQWSLLDHSLQQAVAPDEFHFAVIVITALAYLTSFLFLNFPEMKIVKWAFAGFLGSMIFNAFFPHLVSSIFMKAYAPGLITGVLLNIPINSFILYTLCKQRFLNFKAIILSTIIVGLILLFLIPVLFKMGGILIAF